MKEQSQSQQASSENTIIRKAGRVFVKRGSTEETGVFVSGSVALIRSSLNSKAMWTPKICRNISRKRASGADERGLNLFVCTKHKLITFIIGLLLMKSSPQAEAQATEPRPVGRMTTTDKVRVSSLSSLLSSNLDEIAGTENILDKGIYQSATEGPNEISDDPFWNWTLFLNNSNGTEEFWNSNSSGNSTQDGNQLYDVPMYMVVLLSILYGLISVTAVIGNMLVLWVVSVSRRMRTKTNLFIANLALADVIIALFAIPFQFQAALLQRWNLPDFMCAFCPFVQVLSVNLSVFTLSVIAMDRYRAIIYPFRAIQISKREASCTVVFIWIISLILALPQELDYRVIDIEEGTSKKPFCSPVILSSTFRTYYSLGLAVIQYVLPLLIISVAYAKMAAKLWGSNAPGNKEESRDENTLRNKKKVVKMLAVVVFLFAICWLPLQLYNFLQTITSINEYQYINIIWFCFHWLAMSNSCYNPFIYAIYSDKFQTEFRLRLNCLRRKRRGDATEDGYGSEGSELEMSRTQMTSTRYSRKANQPRRISRRVSSIESTRITNFSGTAKERVAMTKSKPISTISNNIKTSEAILTTEFTNNMHSVENSV